MKKLFLLMLVSFALAGCTRSKTISVPVEYCSSEATGNTRTGTDVMYVCAGYNKDGACTVNVPIYSEYTEKERVVTCKYKEWTR